MLEKDLKSHSIYTLIEHDLANQPSAFKSMFTFCNKINYAHWKLFLSTPGILLRFISQHKPGLSISLTKGRKELNDGVSKTAAKEKSNTWWDRHDLSFAF